MDELNQPEFGPEPMPVGNADPFSAEQIARLKGMDMADPKYAQLLQNLQNDGRWMPETNTDEQFGIPGGFDATDPSGVYGDTPEAPVWTGDTAPPVAPSTREVTDPSKLLPSYGQGEAAIPLTDKEIAQQYLTGFDPYASEFSQLQQAERDAAAVGQIRAKAEVEELKLRNDKLLDIEADRIELADDREVDLEKRMDEMETLATEIGSTKIDANRYWANKSTGDKVLAGIALALGGYAQGRFGSANVPMQMLQSAIKSDVEEQKANYEIKKGELADKKTAYSVAMDKFKNKDMALASAEVSALNMATRQIEERVAGTEDQLVKAKGNAAIAKIGLQAKQARIAFGQAAAKNAQENIKENNPDFVPGYGIVRNPKMTKEFVEKASKFETTDDSINKIVGMVEDYGFTNTITPGDETFSRVNSLTSMLRGDMRLLILGPGTVNEKEYERLVAIVPMAASSNPIERKKGVTALRTLQGYAKRAIDSDAKLMIKNYVPRSERRQNMGMQKESR